VGAGQTLEYALVHPGSHTYTVQPAGFAGAVTVTGSDTTIAATYSGGQIYRFLMTNPGGTGLALVYELVFKDRAGNTRVTAAREISMVDCTIASYCTAKTNSLGCVPSIGSTGTPSTTAGSGFVVSATNLLNQKAGLYFYGTSGAAAQPFQGGTMCVGAPRFRTSIVNSGGSPSGSDCTGSLSIDFNAYIASGIAPVPLVVGTQVVGQFWSRDPSDAFTTNTTNAIRFTLCQ
jgi:hypothetical protein